MSESHVVQRSKTCFGRFRLRSCALLIYVSTFLQQWFQQKIEDNESWFVFISKVSVFANIIRTYVIAHRIGTWIAFCFFTAAVNTILCCVDIHCKIGRREVTLKTMLHQSLVFLSDLESQSFAMSHSVSDVQSFLLSLPHCCDVCASASQCDRVFHDDAMLGSCLNWSWWSAFLSLTITVKSHRSLEENCFINEQSKGSLVSMRIRSQVVVINASESWQCCLSRRSFWRI